MAVAGLTPFIASEVPGFYTRYLATVKEDLGVAVTLSVAKDHYSSYQAIFDNIVASLRVFRQKNQDIANFVKKKDENLLGDTTFIPSEGGQMDIGAQRKKQAGAGGGDDVTTYGIIGAVVVGAFFLMKKKKKISLMIINQLIKALLCEGFFYFF